MSKNHLYPSEIKPHEPPKIISRTFSEKPVAFRIEQQQLEFSNGEKRTYECIKGGKKGSVLIIAIDKNDNILLIREYCGGRENYELACPKGNLNTDENHVDAANRELREETGYAAQAITPIKTVTLAPGYMGHRTHIMLAQNLHWQPLIGDEPEPIEIFRWPLNKIDDLLTRKDFTESRSITALLMFKHHPKVQNITEF